jgi:salicylate hydroxylase
VDGTVLIAGAGIGGLAAALALSGEGRAVTVVDRRTGFEETGAGLQISPNAARILQAWGLGPALRRAACEPERVVIRGFRSGAEVGGVALGRFMRERYGAPYLVLQRADLQTILLDAVRARPQIRLLLGRTVVAASSGADGAELVVARGSGARETLRGALLAGADGLWSAIRPAVGDDRRPRFHGHVAWRATIPVEAAPAALRGNETGLWLGPRRHVVHYPIRGGRLLNLVAVEARREPVEGWSAPSDASEMARRFAGAAPPLRALLAAPESWLLWSLFDLPAGPMARGRIALLGDAAHPVLPFLAQGAALAIEDAAALARALRASPDDVELALNSYDLARRPRARLVQRHARRNGRVYHAGPVVGFCRDLVIRRCLGPERMTARYDWLYGAA